MKAIKSSFTVRDSDKTENEFKDVNGFIWGIFGFYKREQIYIEYEVVHLPTGYNLAVFRKFGHCRKFINELVRLDIVDLDKANNGDRHLAMEGFDYLKLVDLKYDIRNS